MWYNKNICIARMKNTTNNLTSKEQFSVYKALSKVLSYLRELEEELLSSLTNDEKEMSGDLSNVMWLKDGRPGLKYGS